MNQPLLADASPEKRLFISLLTRDISIVAAFLDLIDNSVNSALEPFARDLLTAEDYARSVNDRAITPAATVHVDVSSSRISITDTAAGISLQAALKHVFKFGRSQHFENLTDRLSVYGLGLKRAFFKLGQQVRISSDHQGGGFQLNLDVAHWATTPEWSFDLSERPPVDASDTGTSIEITELLPDTTMRIGDGVFEGELRDSIERTYVYFLSKFVDVYLNSNPIDCASLAVAENAATDRFEADGVTCMVTAGIGTAGPTGYRERQSGWFVFCNGRAVITADKTAITGWGTSGLPIFQPKHRPFLGTVYFVSSHADRLPWDTTKSGINVDSPIWQRAKRVMATVGRTIVSFLDSRYPDVGSTPPPRDLATMAGTAVDPMTVSVAGSSSFKRPQFPPKKTIRIQYDSMIDDVDRIRKHLSKSRMSAKDVGLHTFDYYLRNEVGQD